MENQSNPVFRLFPGLWVVLAVLALLAGRLAWGRAHYPNHIRQLALKLSAVDIIQKSPVVNHAHTLAGIIHTTDQGIGMFIVDLRTHAEKTLADVKDVDYAPSGAWTFGWSPDDSQFAYSINTNLYLTDGSGDKLIATLALPNGIQPFAWLDNQHCAYLDRDPQLVLLSSESGAWQPVARWPVPDTNGKPRSLQTTRDDVVTWQTDDKLWEMSVKDGQTKEIYSAALYIIKSVSYSPAKAAFLVVENTNHSNASWIVRLSPGAGAMNRTVLEQKPSVTDAQWLNHGSGYALLSAKGENKILTIKDLDSSAEKSYFTAGAAWGLFCDGESGQAYVLGAETSEPPGIWECNQSDLQRVVSPFGREDFQFDFQRPIVGYAKFYDGDRQHVARFDLVPPANFSRRQKYPLIIGPAGYEWSPIPHGVYAQCLSRCGAYVALVNYRWSQKINQNSVDEYTNYVMAVYGQLAKNPNVDMGRVYLFGFSAGTLVLSDLVKQYPDKWKGIMLLNPSALPRPSSAIAARVLAVAGSGENAEGRFLQYQKDLLAAGVPMDWHIHADSQHVVRDKHAMYERVIWMTDTVFGGYGVPWLPPE